MSSVQQQQSVVVLPEPRQDGTFPLERALRMRRSVRQFKEAPLRLHHLGQLLWAAQGVTHPWSFRTAPSAGGLFPLDLLVVASRVTDLPAGLWSYDPAAHRLLARQSGDLMPALAESAFGQPFVLDAPAVFVFCAVYERTTASYGKRGIPYALLEAGHAAQNLALQAVSLSLGTVPIGAFVDQQVRQVLQLDPGQQPIYLMPTGWPW